MADVQSRATAMRRLLLRKPPVQSVQAGEIVDRMRHGSMGYVDYFDVTVQTVRPAQGLIVAAGAGTAEDARVRELVAGMPYFDRVRADDAPLERAVAAAESVVEPARQFDYLLQLLERVGPVNTMGGVLWHAELYRRVSARLRALPDSHAQALALALDWWLDNVRAPQPAFESTSAAPAVVQPLELPVAPGPEKLLPPAAPVALRRVERTRFGPALRVEPGARETARSQHVKQQLAMAPRFASTLEEAGEWLADVAVAQAKTLEAFWRVVQPRQWDILRAHELNGKAADEEILSMAAEMPFFTHLTDLDANHCAYLHAVNAARSLPDPEERFGYLLGLIEKVEPLYKGAGVFGGMRPYDRLRVQLEALGGDGVAVANALGAWVRDAVPFVPDVSV
jgi:hypothetical protein